MPDVVYVVRPGEYNEELRYSLRSLSNLPHDRVWIVGHKPAWVTGVDHISTAQMGTKWDNATGNYLAACSHPGIAEDFVLFNDDFFVVEPVDEVPMMHRGPIRDVADYFDARRSGLTANRYAAEMRATADLLESWGYENPMSYELHVPMPVHKAAMSRVLDLAVDHGGRVHKRTLYGNLCRDKGVQVDDVKVHQRHADLPAGLPFLSSSDSSFRSGRIGLHVRKLFRTPSPYEVVRRTRRVATEG